ncbi:MAG TPA: hypothetical protein VFO34_13465 [Candidatus Acidoferrales bacterium]|nr:hypothetical protein [Candidatus Acidoferrales bacterium]
MSGLVNGLNVAKILRIGGAGVFLAGVALALEHYAIAACVVGGAAAYLVGKKIGG